MADTSKVLTIGLVGVGAYIAYQWFLAPATTAAQASATPAPSGTPTPAPAPAVPAPAPAPNSGFNSLDQIYQRLAVQVTSQQPQNPSTMQLVQGQVVTTPSRFNYFLGQVSSYALDANGMAAAFPGGDVPMTLGQFWSAASQYLAQNKGLRGVRGLGAAGFILSRRRTR